MATPPDAHNHVHGDLHGYLLQARDIHGSVTVNATRALPEIADVSLDPPRLATAVRGRDGLLRRLLEAMVPPESPDSAASPDPAATQPADAAPATPGTDQAAAAGGNEALSSSPVPDESPVEGENR